MFYKDLEDRKQKVIKYIKKNPKATYRDLRKDLHTKIYKVYKKGMSEAFKEAGIKPPRSFKHKTKEENRKLIIEYIKKNPGVGGHTIAKKLKRNPSNFFKTIKKAYKEAGIDYEKYRQNIKTNKSKEKKRKEIVKLIKKNPTITMKEIESKLNIKLINYFLSFAEIYEKAGIKKLSQGERIKIRKRNRVIDFIKKNPLATQREINKACKTKVQSIFKKRIFEAYKKAGIKYPFERLKLYGTALKEIKKRARDFEEQIAVILSGYGNVNRLVKTERGVADIILERKNEKVVIEIKDYQNKEISFSQVRQLNKYLEDLDINLGLLICHKKPKRDSFLIGKNKIFILEKQELDKISKIV